LPIGFGTALKGTPFINQVADSFVHNNQCGPVGSYRLGSPPSSPANAETSSGMNGKD
jgi:hypothetical protein